MMREELQVLRSLPNNACHCNRNINRSRRDKKTSAANTDRSDPSMRGGASNAESLLNSQKGCINSQKWIKIAYSNDNYHFMSNYKVYKSFFD